MGRFFLVENDENNDVRDDSTRCCSDHRNTHAQRRKRKWEFVPDPGEEGAMVPFDSNKEEEEEEGHSAEQLHQESTFRTFYSTSGGRHTDENNNQTHSPQNHWDPAYFGRIEGIPDNNFYYYPSGMVAREAIKPSSWVFSRSFWITSLILVLVAWALQNHLPPAPPPPSTSLNQDQYTTWRDYILQHSIQLLHSFSALALETPLHVGSWWWRGLATDLQIWYQDGDMWQKNRAPTSCSVITQAGEFNGRLKEKIFGQDLAVQLVSDALDAWVQRRSLQVNDHKRDRRPLLLFFTGFTSVGKSTMARALADVVFSPAGCSDGHVLELSGAAYPTDDSFTSTPRVELMHSILHHAQQYPEGSIILLRNVDSMSGEVFKWLLQILSSSSSSGEPVAQRSLPRAHDFGDIPAQCANTIFVFTSSSLGQNAIARTLRQTGGIALHEATHISSLLADLAYDLNLHFKVENSRDMLNALVPFGPLTQDDLGDILRIKMKELSDRFSSTKMQEVKADGVEEEQGPRLALSRWSRLILTDRAIDLLVSESRVEYLEWKRRDQANDRPISFMKIALEGAQSIQGDNNASYKVLLTHIHECFSEGPSKAPITNEKVENNLLYSSQKTVAVVDIDGPSGSMLFLWCGSVESGTRIGGYNSDCHEACRFEWD